MTSEQLIKKAKDEEVEFIDYRFIDLQGTWHHFTAPVSQFNDAVLKEGVGFDGSS
ncbi:MAG: glutamine synthetase, partial [Candidatus Marinimicrobia bacterium]|nr:glutamine synthetase [Candidatus Neomarinimicrobiota bacterium]